MTVAGEPNAVVARAIPVARREGRGLRLCLGVGALAVAALGHATADGARWFGVRGPACPLGACLGPLACPGCGLLRSAVAALHGDFELAWRTHPAGVVVVALLAAGVVLDVRAVGTGRAWSRERSLRRLGHRVLVAALIGGWLLRLLVPSSSFN